jgi:general secretion pathway protein D
MTMNKPHTRPFARRWSCFGIVISLLAPPSLNAQTPPAPDPVPRGRQQQQVTLNFVNADIEAVTRAIGAMVNRQFIVDPRVKGQITLYSERPLTVRDAYLNYLAALRGLGFTVVETGGMLKVVPEADAKLQAGTVQVGPVTTRGDQILTQVFRLNHENPNNLVAVLRPLITPNNTINANVSNNTLVITDYADNLQRLAKIIAALDTPAATDIEVVQLQYAVASDIAPLVQRLADSGGVPGAPAAIPGAPGGVAGPNVIVDARSNSLILRAANPTRLEQMRAIVAKLDRPASSSGGPAGNIWVVHLKNSDAIKLATVLRAAFGGAGGAAAGTQGPGTTSTLQGGVTSLPTTTAGGTAQAPAAAPIGPSQGPSTGGFIQADPSTNSLVITAPEPVYRQVRSMIDQLDSRRAQLYIESLIVEVSGENAADFGFQWLGVLGNQGDKNILGLGTNFDTPRSGNNNIIDLNTAARAGTALPLDQGINIGLVRNFGGTYALSAIARALQTQTNTNIISTPNLITLDNEEAKIIVGSNVPFVTGQFTQTGGAVSNPFQTIERKDVGLTLRIKPQIGEGGTVRLTIFQESSALSDRIAPGTTNAGPTTDKRSIETSVVVDDGAILVLGGLIEDRVQINRSKVPLLGDLPWVGALFRTEGRLKNRTNLMVFLRPIIMRDADAANRLSLDRYELIRAHQKDSQPPQSIVMPINEVPVLPPTGLPPPPAPVQVPESPEPSARPGSVPPPSR